MTTPDDVLRRWLARLVVASSVVFFVLSLLIVVHDLLDGRRNDSWDTTVLVILSVAIGAASAFPVRIGEFAAMTPLATAFSVVVALTPARDTTNGLPSQTALSILAAGAGYALGAGLRRVAKQPAARPLELALPVLTVAAMSLAYRWLPIWNGSSSLAMDRSWASQRGTAVAVMTACVLIPLFVKVLLLGFFTAPVVARRTFIRSAMRVLGPIYGAAASTGLAIAIALPILSLWAIPLIALPLVLARSGLRRGYAMRAERRETIAALATMTDIAGFTCVGHSTRVAALARGVGELLGMSDNDLAMLEDAALLHDIGQVSLSTPIPGGATMEAAPRDQEDLAREGGSIVRRSGVLDDVASIIESQAVPYRQVRELGENVPLAARIIKVCNAFDDLTGAGAQPTDLALERLSLGLGYEYDPAVVAALTQLTQGSGRSGAALPVADPLKGAGLNAPIRGSSASAK